jgi:hypothetical protein
MTTALKLDSDAIKNKKPGCSRFKLLDAITQYSKNEDYQEELVTNDFCEIAAKWLEPLPDLSVPNPRIRQIILEALWELPIETEHLESTTLGKIVRSFSVYPKETRANKGFYLFDLLKIVDLATRLWQRWSRKVNNLPASYGSGEFSTRKQTEEIERFFDILYFNFAI